MLSYEADERLFRRAGRLRRHWRWILAGTGLCALAGLVVSLFLPKTYRATTYVLVSESKIGPASQTAAWQQLATINTYLPLVDNDSLIEREIRKFHLDHPPYNLTVDGFRRKDYLDVRTPKATRLLEVNVEFPDAALAAALANDLAAGAKELNQQMNAQDTQATQEFLKQRLDQATARLAEVSQQLLRLQEAAHMEDLEKQLTMLLGEREQLSAQLLRLRLSLAQDESKARTLQQALSKEPRTFRLSKSVTDDRFIERLSEQAHPGTPAPLSVTEETLNATGEQIRQDLVDCTASAAAEKAGIEAATSRLREVDADIDRLLQRVPRLRSEIEAAANDYKVAREAVDSTTRDYRNASVTVSTKADELQPMAPARVPERPVRPRLLLNTLLGGALGFLLLSGSAALFESLRDLRAVSPIFAPEDEHVGVERS
ncbi:MAG: hypothetical protein LAN62_06115 [Acidobacteriia bacterium]|nr:hypothetical protein [Terriglobia bacterium]